MNLFSTEECNDPDPSCVTVGSIARTIKVKFAKQVLFQSKVWTPRGGGADVRPITSPSASLISLLSSQFSRDQTLLCYETLPDRRYSASRGSFLANLLACTKSFASLVLRDANDFAYNLLHFGSAMYFFICFFFHFRQLFLVIGWHAVLPARLRSCE